eukprot:CAMPEP_0170132170 /NCGR_PEP_ID=MMETSP0020_2-20130122/23703_1 /TAXON_ID=98059 /ORGANISM="Dinobryon sp., Strain UTEXLB2267" /LENGTH=129 /DNA_ID=CAMNT_0010367423 /DNA_START=1584 /DNA_END=1974 /DNA_ORIENTATION=+
MHDLLPGVIFRPWDNESLRVASFVTSSAITLFMPTNNKDAAHYPGQNDQKRAVSGVIGLSLTADGNPSTACTLLECSYYVVIYCCTKGVDVNAVDLPPATVVVPYETVQHILYPFGLNQMEIMADMEVP